MQQIFTILLAYNLQYKRIHGIQRIVAPSCLLRTCLLSMYLNKIVNHRLASFFYLLVKYLTDPLMLASPKITRKSRCYQEN